jgi:ParB/Sulfiredoxin domain
MKKGKASSRPNGKIVRVECAHDKIVLLSDLKEHPANPNKHPPEQVALLAKIIRASGWRNPIVVSNRSGLITKGHARFKAATLLREKSAPVDFQDYDSEKEEIADMIADNRLAELADLDRSMLRELAEQLDDGAFDMDLTGFDNAALEELMTAAPPEQEKPRQSDDDYSKFELVMFHENKIRFVAVLDLIRSEQNLITIEESMMFLIDQYEKGNK